MSRSSRYVRVQIIANIAQLDGADKLRRTVLVGSERMAIYDDGEPRPSTVRSRRGVSRPGDVWRIPSVLSQRRRCLAEDRLL